MIPRSLKSAADAPRDVIARFHYYEDKAKVMKSLRDSAPTNFNGAELLIFLDLASKVLVRRKALKPLLAILKTRNIQYKWGS